MQVPSEVSNVPKRTFASEDSDPIITFESPSSTNHQKAAKSLSEELSKTCLNANKVREKSSLMKSCRNKFLLDKIQPLQNSSVTIQYLEIPQSDSCKDIFSDTDEEYENENTNLETKQSVTNETCSKDEKMSLSLQKTRNNCIETNVLSDTFSSKTTTSSESRRSESILGSNSLNISSTKKESFTKKKNIAKKQVVNLKDSDESLPANVPETDSNNGANLKHSQNLELSGSSGILDEESSTTFSNKIFSLHPWLEEFTDEPLRYKIALLNEKSSQAYFKVPYETNANCVNRIYSLITEWQAALAQYQNKLLNPCRWGPPISVDRHLKNNNLVKKNNTNHLSMASCNVKMDYIDTSSSASESFVSDTDDDFEIFPGKKKKNVKRVLKKNLLPHKMTELRTENQDKITCNEVSITNGTTLKQNEKENDPQSSHPHNNIEMKVPSGDEALPESPSIPRDIEALPVESEVMKTTENPPSLLTLDEESHSSSQDIFTSQPFLSTDVPFNKNQTTQNNKNAKSTSEDEFTAQSLLIRAQTKMHTRSIKRKISPNPFSTPHKKTATSSDNQENSVDKIMIKPGNVRLKPRNTDGEDAGKF